MTATNICPSIGWSIQDWIDFHFKSTPKDSYESLLELVKNQRIAPEDPAWISVATESLLEQQWQLLQSRHEKEKLPLYGVPIAVKDNIDAKGFPTTAACPSFSYMPTRDSTVVELLKQAGAIIIGKTNLDQFATGLVGTRSPYGRTPCVFSDKHVSGGSSAGSASVVARGIVPIALGTDTAGSGRVPAALNNIIGLKPTRGIFSCSGVVPACKSLDCVSVFSMNLSDAEKCLKIMTKLDIENDEYSRSFPANPLQSFNKNLTVAIPKNVMWYGEKENPLLYDRAIDNFKQLGAQIKIIDFEPLLELARCLYEGTWVAERYAATRKFLETSPQQSTLDPVVYGIIKSATKFDAADAFEYEYKRQGILRKVEVLLQDIDVLCVPTCPLNPSFEDVDKEPILVNSRQGTWTNFVNLADLSALAIPVGFRSDGLPNGVTLIAKKFEDYALLQLAKRFLAQLYPSGTRPYGMFLDRYVGLKDDSLEGPIVSSDDSIVLAVVGAHLRGLPLHWQLEKVNATFICSTKTAKKYELYALLKNGPVLKPGLRRITSGTGSQIELELYSVPKEKFGEFISFVPEPLGIGSVELENGKWVKSFICEESGYNSTGSIDISHYGGFRAYIESIKPSNESKKGHFKTVLVANRGEIAVRIIKTLKSMQIKSLAIYSATDKYSQHVLDADMAQALDGHTVEETYLHVEKIISIAKKYDVDAIIPGYGFLSENASFADRCEQEGIQFIGPRGETIRKLGLKHSAREVAKSAGVPLVPGSPLVKNADEAFTIAKNIGYPVMVKSTAGGGGIGLQKVDNEQDMRKAFETVKHQGSSYFGDSGVFMEKFIDNARHVEVQIMGDGKGKTLALGERDCSLQRRNQKVIEETPAPNLPRETRQKMLTAAERLGAYLNYRGAGTVEFIYDEQRDQFYFLEVNTRLQVEHPITEMVTGLDLVEWMIKISAGVMPSLDEFNISQNGASIEVRVYAENPLKDFRPSPGELVDVQFPNDCRVDTWVKKGTKISPEFDPTLAKIIVHGKDRNEAILKMKKALNETKIYGCVTNVDYLKSLISSEMFRNAQLSTNYLNTYEYSPSAVEIIEPGALTTIQDYPGRVNYWRIGVPPCGPMDNYSFRLANRIVGNDERTPGIEITLTGPTIKFYSDSLVSIAGGEVCCKLDEKKIPMFEPISVKTGSVLSIGKIVKGSRAYLAIRGGIDVPKYMGSFSTFTMGNLGGFNGRALKRGDVLSLPQQFDSEHGIPSPCFSPEKAPIYVRPDIPNDGVWTIGVLAGPHGAPDIFESEGMMEFFKSEWKVHYNSNRFGVRLIGPKPKWSRTDGGEGGLHPSNTHDYVYSLGAINFTGDEPVIITCDGPSLGGFVCQAVVSEAEMWKVGQLKPGDTINFTPIDWQSARNLKENQDVIINDMSSCALQKLSDQPLLKSPEDPILFQKDGQELQSPKVVYRQAGDRYILIEYGDDIFELNLCYRIKSLIDIISQRNTKGIKEMSQGVRSVLVEYDGYEISQKELLKTLIAYEEQLPQEKNWSVKSRIFRLPMAFEDKETLACVKRYQETIRSKAPWLPNNVDFVAEVNNLTHDDIRQLIYTTRYMVLGVGDVFLGSPCAIPLDPRNRLLGSKYNPSRTFTKRGVVGIGGSYMCIYAADSPGGYQLVGRTIPIWDRLMLQSKKDEPWLLSPFDQIEFYPVSEEQIDEYTDEWDNGNYKIDVDDVVFDHGSYLKWVQDNIEAIEEHQRAQRGDNYSKFAQKIQEANADLKQTTTEVIEQNILEDDCEYIFSEYAGRFWKPIVEIGASIEKDQGVAVIEAMKTEMIVSSSVVGKLKKFLFKNGDMVDAGDPVAIIQCL